MEMTTDFSFDVFLGHSAQDKARVRRLTGRRGCGSGSMQGHQAGRRRLLGHQARAVGGAQIRALPVAGGTGVGRSTVLCRDPCNASRRFILFLLADCNPLGMLNPKADCRAEDSAKA